MRVLLATSLVLISVSQITAAAAADKTLDLTIGGVVWAKTVITPYDDSSKESRDATFKVYTEVMDFAGKEPITKGLGGLYPHHRGLFIGWRETTAAGKKFDTWHMTDCYQQFTGKMKLDRGPDRDAHTLGIEWRGNRGTPILDEQRTIVVQPGSGGIRIFDFASVLTAVNDITLRADSHHAGMQIRLSNEVAEHQDATVYLLPEGAKRLENDEVSGAWWAVCNAKIGGKPYWVMHMTPPDLPAELKRYSIRPYARFGAFFEPDLKKGESKTFTVRVIVSEQEIDAVSAKALYADYAKAHPK
jgi:hypothetical protein